MLMLRVRTLTKEPLGTNLASANSLQSSIRLFFSVRLIYLSS